MTDFERLIDKLSKLGRKTSAAGGPRILRAADPAGVLAAIVTEIDETILPRRLTFTVGDASLSLAVSDRRCQAVLSPLPAIDGIDGLADAAIEAADSPLIATLKGALQTMIGDANEVSVVPARLPVGAYATDAGVLASRLAEAWGLETTGGVQRSPEAILEEFFAVLDTQAETWLHIDGQAVVKGGGSEQAQTALGEQAIAFLAGYFDKFDELYPNEGGPVMTVLAAEGARAIIFAEIGESSAFASATADAVPGLVEVWARLTDF